MYQQLRKNTLILFSLLLITSFCTITNANLPAYKNGMVVTAHPEASKVGINILKQKGNAVDAAVAVQFALAVVYPNAGNIGGGGFMVYRSKTGESATLDFREKAPASASRKMYLDQAGNAITDKSLYGHLAPGVPGSVAGMLEAHQKYGKLSWKQVIQPAIDLAKKGFPLTTRQAEELNNQKQNFIKFNPEVTAFINQKTLWKQGDLLLQPELAKTLERIRDHGRAGFYEGETASLIVAEMKRGKGLITKEDLKNYHAVWRTPIIGNYKGYKIITMPPPSSGGIALLQLLEAVDPYPLKRWGQHADSTIQLIVEAERRVYADRATHLGDPDFYKVPQQQLLNPAYQLARMSSLSWNKATPSTDIKAGQFSAHESPETTHFSIADQEGNAVSITTTLNGSYGSLVVVSGAGFLLNNEMDDFSVKPGTPNMYGLVGGEANAIQPNKRMLSSMTPTILEKDGKLFMVLGTPGGSTIITSVFQTILNVIEFDQSMQEAVEAKRFHHQWLPDEVYTEDGTLSPSQINILQQKGYKISPREPIGRVDAILTTQDGYTGGADPRGDDTKSGY
ncbi:Gamma-glutamyltranspeptidase [Arcticibacter svalbardensis MN12-7]|uniref:Glutathione hydrolase proenzyme n=1 Tax=Arcticibacter svalbardensis MN12-7 TaxID=1150600 RepID=R9GYT4_9SPHI|nr:gamma-glutamyltransferase [Arcticibacter svalbardensis]EOR94124.1 Gamma-glutamyltranspeptidase [Arcticibacter svalbardensis MN12-7]